MRARTGSFECRVQRSTWHDDPRRGGSIDGTDGEPGIGRNCSRRGTTASAREELTVILPLPGWAGVGSRAELPVCGGASRLAGVPVSQRWKTVSAYGCLVNKAPTEPIGKCMKVAGEAAEPPRRFLITLRRYRDVNLLRSNIDAGRIRLQHHRSAFSLLSSLRPWSSPFVAGERGPRRESLQSPDRDRCTAPQTSSLTYPQPQTHACGRAYQAPMPTSSRSLPQSPAHLSSLASSSFRSYLNEVQSIACGQQLRHLPC